MTARLLILSLLASLACADVYLYDFTLYERDLPPKREVQLLAHLNKIFEIFDDKAEDWYPYLPPGAVEPDLVNAKSVTGAYMSPQKGGLPVSPPAAPTSALSLESPSDAPSSIPTVAEESETVVSEPEAEEPVVQAAEATLPTAAPSDKPSEGAPEYWDSLSWSDANTGWHNGGGWQSSNYQSGSWQHSYNNYGQWQSSRGWSGSSSRSQYQPNYRYKNNGGTRGLRGTKERELQISQCPGNCERRANWNKCRKLGCKCSCGKRRAQENSNNDYFGFTITQDLDSTLLLEIEMQINKGISHYCTDIVDCEVMIEITKIPLFQEEL